MICGLPAWAILRPVTRGKSGWVVRVAEKDTRLGEQEAGPVSETGPGDSLSMHANVPVWCDCCTCEAEPYWVEAFRETGDDS